ncbi:MAG: HAD-IA family hydrolase [candidate division Zixibacteria bacterium]|nr:HAD-IA family hydrolase [candidate division Zixibacteria bacterium]
MITTVLLDAGGVILDEREHERIHAKIIVGIIGELVQGYSFQHFQSDIDQAVNTFCPSVYRYILWKYSSHNVEIFERLYSRHLELWNKMRPPLKLMDGIGSEIKKLSRNFYLVIAGQYGKEILELLESEALLQYFKSRLTQDDFNITKPDPRYLERIIRRIGAAPAQCVMVGDRIDNDIVPAKQLGLKTVLIRTGLHKDQMPRIPDEIPDAELKDISQLSATITALS